jgi:hypothetical protein
LASIARVDSLIAAFSPCAKASLAAPLTEVDAAMAALTRPSAAALPSAARVTSSRETPRICAAS